MLGIFALAAGNQTIRVIQVNYGDARVKLRRYRDVEAPLTVGYAILTENKPPAYAERVENARRDLAAVYTR
jgi:hypothetical protein